MSKTKVITIIFIIGAVILGIKGKSLLNSKQQEIKNQPLPSLPEITVDIAKVKEGTLYQKTPFLAQVEADKSIKLSTKLAGFVEKVFVRESQSVKKGDILVRIDAQELKATELALKSALTAQENDLLLAKKIYNRNKKLYKVGGISKEMLETSLVGVKMKKSIVESTKQKIVGIQNQLSYLDIKAPFDGKIDSIILHEGDLAVTGKPILAMSNKEKKLVFSYALSKDIPIKVSQLVVKNSKVIGKIKTIYNTAKNGLSMAEVKLKKEIDEPIGSSVSIEVVTKLKKGCILSSDTVLHKKDGEYIMVYEDKKFSPKKIEALLYADNSVLIKSCPKQPVAKAAEAKLAQLPLYDKVNIAGVEK